MWPGCAGCSNPAARTGRRAVLPGSGPGYLLRLEPGRLDAEALNQHLAQTRRAPGGGPPGG